jgi:hypothetical protein
LGTKLCGQNPITLDFLARCGEQAFSHLRGDSANSNIIQDLDEFWVFLSVDLFQLKRNVDAVAPALGLEAEFFGGRQFRIRVSFDDWWKLKKVTAKDQLDASEWTIISADLSGHLLDLIKVVSIDHRNFVDYQSFALSPGLGCGWTGSQFYTSLETKVPGSDASK